MDCIQLLKKTYFERFIRKCFSFLNLKATIFIWRLLVPNFSNSFFQLNKLNFNILYYLLYKNNFNSFLYYTQKKFDLFEENIFEEYIIDSENNNKQLKWDNLKIIGPLESIFESDDNTIFILMKKNKNIKVDKSIIFPNHIYSSKNNFSNNFKNIIYFHSDLKSIISDKNIIKVPYPKTISKVSSPMALQRIIFFLNKYVDYKSVSISGFNLYAGKYYDRSNYPSLVKENKEKEIVAHSLISHGILFNWKIVNYYNETFQYDKYLKSISNSSSNYLNKLYNSFWQ